MKRLLTALMSVFAFAVIAAAPVSAQFDPLAPACSQAGTGSSSACKADGSNPLTGPTGIITKITGLIAVITGIAAVIVLIYGGLMYVLSGGDSNKVNKAKDTLLYAIIGIAIAASSQAIVSFVLNKI